MLLNKIEVIEMIKSALYAIASLILWLIGFFFFIIFVKIFLFSLILLWFNLFKLCN